VDIAAAILCDAATVREGLLHMLGGPITRLYRPGVPAPLGVALASIIEMERDDLDVPHELNMILSNSTGQIAQATGALQLGTPPKMEADEIALAPFVMPLQMVGTGSFGRHAITLTLDVDACSREMVFWVLHTDEMHLPAI